MSKTTILDWDGMGWDGIRMLKINFIFFLLLILAVTRVGGNKKGIFTRSRQPKEAAHHVRRRYHSLSNQMNQSRLPDDLFPYLVDESQKFVDNRIEL